MQLTLAQLRAALPAASPANCAKYLEAINATFARFDISTPLRAAHFLTQIGHESINLTATVENLNYSVDAILKTFGRHRISEADARKYGYVKDAKGNVVQASQPEKLANLIYGGAWGLKNLGNSQPGDGWKFRGRGAIQTTGRANFQRAGKALGLDLVGQPELLNVPEHWAATAGVFWKQNNLNKYADLNDLVTLRRIANGGSLGLDTCRKMLPVALAAFGLDTNGKPIKK